MQRDTAPEPADAAGSRTIYDDLNAGEPPIPIGELTSQTFIPRRHGKQPDRSVGYRWATTGKNGHRIETIKTPTGTCTTRSAVMRFFAALTGEKGEVDRRAARTPSARLRAQRQAAAELAAAGI